MTIMTDTTRPEDTDAALLALLAAPCPHYDADGNPISCSQAEAHLLGASDA